MSKKFFSKLFTSVVLAVSTLFVIDYFNKKNKTSNDLDENLDLEVKRDYIKLKEKTNDFKKAAKDTANVAKSMVAPGKEIFKELGNIITDKVKNLKTSGENLIEDIKEDLNEDLEEIKEDIEVLEEDLKEVNETSKETTEEILNKIL